MTMNNGSRLAALILTMAALDSYTLQSPRSILSRRKMGLLSWFGGAEKAVEKGGNDAIASRHASTVDTAQEYIHTRFVDSYVTELKVKVADKCFQKCFDAKNSSSKIDTSENGCQAMCCDRYLDTMEHVRKVLQQRSRK